MSARLRRSALLPVGIAGLLFVPMSAMSQARPQEPGEKAASRQDANSSLRTRAEQGDANAQFGLGLSYSLGAGVPLDYVQAAKWYRRAAEQGYADAQYILGTAYDNGTGVPKDETQAAMWYRKAAAAYRKAADQGNSSAQFNLGNMYFSGQGVPKDEVQAAVWFRKAADQGNSGAKARLQQLEGK